MGSVSNRQLVPKFDRSLWLKAALRAVTGCVEFPRLGGQTGIGGSGSLGQFMVSDFQSPPKPPAKAGGY